MSEDAPEPRKRHRLTRWPVIFLAGAAALVAVAWLERRPVIRHFVDDTLARDHVTARYTLTDVGLGRQRLTDVVIGDPAHPDLVADWIETEVGYGMTGPKLIGVRAGRVRLAGRIADRRLSLGSIDRLLPAPSAGGGPIVLPAIALAVADARMRLETSAGPVGIALTGSGRLNGGFAGRVAATAGALGKQTCGVGTPRLTAHITILSPQRGATRLRLTGPLRWDAARCAEVATGGGSAAIDATLSSRAIDGHATLAITAPGSFGVAADAMVGTISVAGAPPSLAGMVDLRASRVRGAAFSAASATVAGRYAMADPRLDATIGLRGFTTPFGARAADALDIPPGTPMTPLAMRLAPAVRAATIDLDGEATVRVAGGAIIIDRATATSRSGAQLTYAGTARIAAGDVAAQGRATLGGGGLPTVTLDLTNAAAGTLHVDRYAAGSAAIEPATIRIVHHGDSWRTAGAVTVSGPLGSGRVDRLRLPLAALLRGRRLALSPGCTPVSADRLGIGSLTLVRPEVTLCATGVALVNVDHGRVDYGARMAPLRLEGTMGGAPLFVAAGGGLINRHGFAIDRIAARLGSMTQPSLLDIGRLDGAIVGGAIAGRFADAGGRIGAVPLALSQASGDWRLASGTLALTGALTVADAASPASTCKPPFGADAPRFCPLDAREVRLTLADGKIDATGALYAPRTIVRIANVDLRHDLSSGAGHAGFAVPGIAFGKELQPDRLTPASFGIVADVKGSVSGNATIDWSGAGVTSGGRFTTAGLDLAAAFGPVTGISGTIDFDDLLALATPPEQTLRVASINPGVAVNDGVVTYRLRPGSIVDVAGARWPFAGGTLTLEPTTLDLAHPVAKRLTFRVDGMQAAQFLQQFDFKNLDATGVFDGTLPMVFDEAGGRIENGRLTVREGGGTIAYVGDLTEKDLGFWGNLAFQALKSLRYRSLNIEMNGPLAGEMVTGVRFAGVQQGEGAKANFLVRRLQRLPFVFNITIRAPFRGLIDSAQSFYDPRRLLSRLPEATPAVQPAASAPVLGTPLTPPR